MDGEKHGKGKEYNNDGELVYDSEYFHGKKYGILFYFDCKDLFDDN